MDFAAMGKRFERLLFFTAPISLAAIIVLTVARAADSQKERVDGKCLELAAGIFSYKLPELQKQWEPSTSNAGNFQYKSSLKTAWITADKPWSCHGTVDAYLEENFHQAPDLLIKKMKERSSELVSQPLKMYGVELPKAATVNIFVAQAQIPFDVFVLILQIVLFPILLLWLGSLYVTRFREAIMISQAVSFRQIFPHIINMYPSGPLVVPRKRSRLAPYARPLVCVFAAFVRICLLSMFIIPPVSAYICSLYYTYSGQFLVLHLAAGFVVFMFTAVTLFHEFLPHHMLRMFPVSEA